MKQNLILSRNGPESLHIEWLDCKETKNWDLITLFYEESAFENRIAKDRYQAHYMPGGKWDTYHNFLSENLELINDYDYIWFPDDDISISGDDISKMFVLMKEFDLDIGQPSMSLESYFSYLVLIQCSGLRLRFSNFAEVMAPCLRNNVVTEMLPFFEGSFTGMGLESIWCFKTRKEPNKIAIFDEINMTHTRPIGGPLHKKMYDMNMTPNLEIKNNLSKLNVKQVKPVIFSSITKKENQKLSKIKTTMMMFKEYYGRRKEFKDNKKILSRIRRLLKYHLIYRIKPIF